MLLRKHISGGIVKSIDFYDYERIIGIVIEKRTEMGDLENRTLMVEVMGKYSNIILLNQSSTILDSIKHIDFSISSKREVMPARPYEMPPPQDKISLEALMENDFNDFLKTDTVISKHLLSSIKGFSPALINEILHRAGIETETLCKKLSYDNIDALRAILYDLLNTIENNEFNPCIVYDIDDGTKPVDFHSILLTHHINIRKIDSILDTLGVFYTDKDRYIRLKQKKSDLLRIINTKIKSVQKKINIHTNNISKNENYDKHKEYGDLILSNLYTIKEGMRSCDVQNYYTETNEMINITLDPNLNPQDNAQVYYKKYTKSKSRFENANKQLKIAVNELRYLESVLMSLELSTEYNEINEIKEELIKQEIVKKSSKKSRESFEESNPLKYISTDGDIIMVGKNNRQNDYLSTRYSSPKDLWLHVKNNPGAHVIVKKTGKEITEKTIFEAASLAAFYSKLKNATTAEVDYTEIKHVKKIPGGKPGMVIYHEFKTINVKPEILI
jgi:predicted ribosome quality control (RQC) complex YloA/Tae2 family protein